jgi:hypothetical protein
VTALDTITSSMEQSPSCQGDSNSSSQEIFLFFINPKLHSSVHKNPLLVPMLSQMNPVHSFLHYFCKIRSNNALSSHLCLCSPSDVSLNFSTYNLCSFLISHMRATCFANFTLPDFIKLIIFNDSRRELGIFLLTTASRTVLGPI